MLHYIKFLRLSLPAILFLLTSIEAKAQIPGCTDSLANNYNADATVNNGSCTYHPVTIDPVNSWTLPDTLNETSGIIYWDKKFWTHNDDTDVNIYGFDTTDVNNLEPIPLSSQVNTDWEEISQDDDYIYIGDFGNNRNGNRTDLKILRIDKVSFLQNNPVVDTISFSYSLQTDFTATGANKTDFDCEAFIVTADSIYLFTKEWLSNKSSVYSLPKTPGEYTANFIAQYDVKGLITGATYLENKRIIVLSGYSQILQPFIFLLYDFQNYGFFRGNKRKISVNLPFHQVEGITTEDGLNYYITNEKFTHSAVTTIAKFHSLDLSDYLIHYINKGTTYSAPLKKKEIKIYPNPATHWFNVQNHTSTAGVIKLSNTNGKIIQDEIKLPANSNVIMDASNLSAGIYVIRITSGDEVLIRKIIIRK